MLYILIGLFFAAAFGALMKARHKNGAENNNASADTAAGEAAPVVNSLGVPVPGVAAIEPDLDSALSAKPISSPDTVASATYSAAAPLSAGSDSPYSYGATHEAKQKTKPAANLLRWCGRSSSIKVNEGSENEFEVLNPVTYWSNGPSTVKEPCCIDISLPVEFLAPGDPLPSKGAVSYAEMTPVQRGIYLTWLAGGRIQPPLHLCYPAIWLYGLERRAVADRLDLGVCISEAFRMLPLARWDEVLKNYINFITWLAVKIWLPEDELLNLCKKIQTVPDELLSMLVSSYANSKLPLPSAVAFTVMRTSARLRRAALGDNAFELPHSDEILQQFTPIYKNACSGGMVLPKTDKIITLTYKPTNPSLNKPIEDEREAKSKKAKQEADATITIPNFFENLDAFTPLIKVWREFAPGIKLPKAEPETAAESLEERPDFEQFLLSLIPNGNENAPLISTIAALGDLLNLTHPDINNVTNENIDEYKLRGRDRKTILDAAAIEGWQIVPNLSLSGREYYWHDKLLYLPIEFGAVLSRDYYASAYLLEFICSLCEAAGSMLDVKNFDLLRANLNEYFNLSDDENSRLNAQIVLNIPAAYNPEYYGAPAQIWLTDPAARASVRDFIIELLNTLPDGPSIIKVITPSLNVSLDVQPRDPNNPAELEEPKTRGANILTLLEPLFKNS